MATDQKGKLNILYIIQGYFNHIAFKLGMKDNPEWNRRRKICASCTTNVNGKCSKKVCEVIDNRRTCGCGCYIEKKIKSSKPCPKNKW